MVKELAGPRPANSQNSRLGYDCVNQLTLSFGKTQFSTIGRYFSKVSDARCMLPDVSAPHTSINSADHRTIVVHLGHVLVSGGLTGVASRAVSSEQLWVQYYLTGKKWGAEEIPPHLLFRVAPVHIGPAPTLVPVPPPTASTHSHHTHIHPRPQYSICFHLPYQHSVQCHLRRTETQTLPIPCAMPHSRN